MEIQEENTLLKRPTELEADVVRFQNQKDKWIAFVGLRDGKPYEIFTGLADDEQGIALPKAVTRGKIIRAENEDGTLDYVCLEDDDELQRAYDAFLFEIDEDEEDED